MSEQGLQTPLEEWTKPYRYGMAALATVGLMVSFQLLKLHFVGEVPSFCNVNNYVDCQSVAQSDFSSFLGIPLALYGFGYYSLALVLILVHIAQKDVNRAYPIQLIQFGLALVAVLVSVVLGFISVTQIHKICLLCVMLYGVNAGLLWLSKGPGSFVSQWLRLLEALKKMSQSPTRLLIAALVIVCVALVGVLVQANMPEDKASQPAQEQAVTQNDATPSATDDSQETSLDSLAAGETIGNVLGSKNPYLVIHEYTDYQCPYCALSLGNFLRLVKEMKNVQVVHHDYPLNAECNPSIQGKGHAYACVASRYARAAEKQGKFWDLSVLLYLNQRQLSEEKILSLAESIGLDTKKLKQDADSAQLKQELAKDVEAANTVQKIEGTPTMFIEGNRYQGVMPYDELKALVQAHLRGEKPEPPKED